MIGKTLLIENTAQPVEESSRQRLVPLNRVPKLGMMPRNTRGKRIHVATVYKWAQRGLKGGRLRTWKVGRVRCTTEQALLEFFERTDGGSPNPQDASSSTPRRSRQARAAQQAKQKLGL